MKKIFLTAVVFLSIVASSASAQDIYAASKDGCDYFVVSETVKHRDLEYRSDNGEIFRGGETTGNVKKIRDGKLLAVRSWRFGAFYGHAIVYRIDGVIIGAFNSPESFYAQKIMHVMDRCIGRR